MDPLLATNYTVTWTSETDRTPLTVNTMETSYTITGLTLDTVYTITVSAANMCGRGPDFNISISFPTGMISFLAYLKYILHFVYGKVLSRNNSIYGMQILSHYNTKLITDNFIFNMHCCTLYTFIASSGCTEDPLL